MREIQDNSGASIQGKEICEVGTGWYALTPLTMYALGAEGIRTHDIVDWLTPDAVADSVSALRDNSEWLAEEFNLEPEYVADRVASLESDGDVGEILATGNTTYHLTGCDLAEPADEYDLFYSYSVLHRIPEAELRTFLSRANDYASAGALQFHVIEHTDIYARHDEDRNPYAYLQYSDGQFEYLQTEFSYQNRMRHSDFVSLFLKYGWQTVYERLGRDDPALVEGLDLAERFQDYDPVDLATRRTRTLLERTGA